MTQPPRYGRQPNNLGGGRGDGKESKINKERVPPTKTYCPEPFLKTSSSQGLPRTRSPEGDSEYKSLRRAPSRRQHQDALRFTKLQAQERASRRRQEKARALAKALEDEERKMRTLAERKIRLMGICQGVDKNTEKMSTVTVTKTPLPAATGTERETRTNEETSAPRRTPNHEENARGEQQNHDGGDSTQEDEGDDHSGGHRRVFTRRRRTPTPPKDGDEDQRSWKCRKSRSSKADDQQGATGKRVNLLSQRSRSYSDDRYLKMSFLNQAIPKLEPSYKTNKHHRVIHACIDYLGDSRVRKSDLEAVIHSRLPLNDRKWFQTWWQEGKYDNFERAFREKYGTSIAFGEFKKYLNEFNFNKDMGAIKNAWRLRDHTRSVIALLAKECDKERAQWALLEFFKDRLDPQAARWITGEHKDKEVKMVDKYTEYLQALEGNREQWSWFEKKGASSQILDYKPEGVGEYDAYKQQEKRKPKKNMNVIMPQGYGAPIRQQGAVQPTPQTYPATNQGAQGYPMRQTPYPPPTRRIRGGMAITLDIKTECNALSATTMSTQKRSAKKESTFCNYNGHTEEKCRETEGP